MKTPLASLFRLSAIVLSLASFVPALQAQKIRSATVDLPSGTITLNGGGFTKVSPLTVSMDGTLLTVQSLTDNSITALLGSMTAPGTYLVAVDAVSTSQQFDITIGAVGPQGVAGIQGPAGPQGLTGPAGAIGATGSAGPTGATGLTGLKGDTGPTGAIGVAGPTGPMGVAGPSGPTGLTGATGAHGVLGYVSSIGNVTIPSRGTVTLASTTIPAAGTYLLIGKVDASIPQPNGSATVTCNLIVNGTTTDDSFALIGAPAATSLIYTGSLQSVVALDANDKVVISCRPNNGAQGNGQAIVTALQLK